MYATRADPAPIAPTPSTEPPWRALELLLMSQVMRLVGQSLAPEVVLREMLHLLSELLGLNRGRVVLADATLRMAPAICCESALLFR